MNGCCGCTGGEARRKPAGETCLIAARAEPATGGEVEGASGAGGGVEQGEVAVAVDPGAAHDEVVGRAVGWHQAEHLPCAPQLDPRPPCTCAWSLSTNVIVFREQSSHPVFLVI